MAMSTELPSTVREETEKVVTATSVAIQFVPFFLVWPIWFFTMISGGLWSQVFQYWPASIAMVFGSFIAGSTPLGGGVVAFPVSVLVLKFTSQESRDASILVQAVGMNAAAYLLLATKRELLDFELIIVNIVAGTLGMLAGCAYFSLSSFLSLRSSSPLRKT